MSKVAFITGATSGFGRATARRFAEAGWILVLSGRRLERLEELKAELQDKVPVHIAALDVRDAAAVKALVDGLQAPFDRIDVLVNNAGLALAPEAAQKVALQDWHTMIDTNITGLVQMTRAILPTMVARDSGLIINIGSTAGNHPYSGANVYGASKAFVKQFSNNLRADLIGTRVRVTNIEPGMCGGTEFSNVRFKGDDDKAAAVYTGVEFLTAKDISNTVQWVVAQPWHVNINAIEMMPTAQTYAGLAVARDI